MIYAPILLFLTFFSNIVFAQEKFPVPQKSQLDFSPPNFYFQNQKAVFVDFKRARYTFLIKDQITITSTIEFFLPEDGHALFDLVPGQKTIQVLLDGKLKSFAQEVPLPSSDSSKMRMLTTYLSKGNHKLSLTHVLDEKSDVKKSKSGLELIFRFCDGISKRKLLERYLPSNLQYDQYEMKFNIRFNDQKSLQKYEIISNGSGLKRISEKVLQISFPKFFNAASPFFHIFPKGRYELHSEFYKDIKITVYKSGHNRFYNSHSLIQNIIDILKNLEGNFGTYHYKFMIVFYEGLTNGIEHAGATRTSVYSLFHEIFHFFFGRGAMPANGGVAGNLDEDLARWADGGPPIRSPRRWFSDGPFSEGSYKQYSKLPSDFQGYGYISPYRRGTGISSWEYYIGAQFIGYLDYLVDGEMKSFLKYFCQKYRLKLYDEEIFIAEFNRYFQKDFTEVFKRLFQTDHLN